MVHSGVLSGVEDKLTDERTFPFFAATPPRLSCSVFDSAVYYCHCKMVVAKALSFVRNGSNKIRLSSSLHDLRLA
jgi:hypothetical protein